MGQGFRGEGRLGKRGGVVDVRVGDGIVKTSQANNPDGKKNQAATEGRHGQRGSWGKITMKGGIKKGERGEGGGKGR